MVKPRNGKHTTSSQTLTSSLQRRVKSLYQATTSSPTVILATAAFALLLSCSVQTTTCLAAKEVATNTFYVKIKPGSLNDGKNGGQQDPSQVAHKIARRNGFHSLGPVLGSRHEFQFIHHALPQARTKRSVRHVRQLKADPHIEHAFQQSGFKREKRYGVPIKQLLADRAAAAAADLDYTDLAAAADKRSVGGSPWVDLRQALDADAGGDGDGGLERFDSHVVHDQGYFDRMQMSANHKNDKRGYNPLKVENLVDTPIDQSTKADPTDPLFQHQWYLKNTGQNGGKPKLDLNVAAAWAQGVTGKNITTAIMDDGVDYMHPDLINNYNARASYDFSSNDPYPYPRYTDDWFNSHGTRCAGEVSGARDNGVCGVGVAYDSMIAGIRMLDQPYMTDLIEANSMGHEPNLIDIYSASWGPTDDGRTVDGPRDRKSVV